MLRRIIQSVQERAHANANSSTNFLARLRATVDDCVRLVNSDSVNPDPTTQSLATVFIIIFVFPSPRPLPYINIYTRKGAGRWKHENDNKNSGKRLCPTRRPLTIEWRHAFELNRYAIWIGWNSNTLLFLFSWLVSDVKHVYTGWNSNALLLIATRYYFL